MTHKIFATGLLWRYAAGLALVFGLALAPYPAHAQDLAQIFAANTRPSTMTVDHTPWGAILKTYIKPGADGVNRFAYGRVTADDKAKLKSYLTAMQAVDPATLGSDEQRAYWINLYNALTVDVVLGKYPVASIRDISSGLFTPGPWKLKLITIKGQSLALDDIEHNILRKVWSDARIHFAVNCASMGCPNLQAVPFTGKTLDAMLDQGARDFINHPRGFAVDAKGAVKASRIFEWYARDFGKNDTEILAFASKFASPALKPKLAAARDIDIYDYDWTLNDAK